MEKIVSVKKCKSHRYALRFLAVLFAAFPFIIATVKSLALFALPGCIPILLFIPVMLYYETWQIRFTDTGIETAVFWKKKQYSYTQIRRATKGYAISQSARVIRIEFSNGSVTELRLDDENAAIAEKKLNKHCSIKRL